MLRSSVGMAAPSGSTLFFTESKSPLGCHNRQGTRVYHRLRSQENGSAHTTHSKRILIPRQTESANLLYPIPPHEPSHQAETGNGHGRHADEQSRLDTKLAVQPIFQKIAEHILASPLHTVTPFPKITLTVPPTNGIIHQYTKLGQIAGGGV
jgi:hypothetical protein